MDCSEKRPFICERSASRLQARNPPKKLPAELTNDLSQSLPILVNDLKVELEGTVPALSTQSLDLITIILADQAMNGPLSAVVNAINALKGTIVNLIGVINLGNIQCTDLKTKHDYVLVLINILIQNESSLPAFLSKVEKVAIVQYFANKLKKRHLQIQSSILKVCP